MGDLAFITTYTATGQQVTRWGDEWPDEIQIHGDLWKQMLERKCLPWAVADVSFESRDINQGMGSAPHYVQGPKDGRVEFRMDDGKCADYRVTSQDPSGIVSLQLVSWAQP